MTKGNKVKAVTVFNDITLGTTEATTQAVADRVIVDTYFSKTLNFVCKYTSGSTKSPSPSASPSVSPSASPSVSPSASPSVSPSVSVSPSISPSVSPSGSISPSVSPSVSISPSISPSVSPSVSISPSVSPSISPSVSISPSISPSLSPSISPSVSPSISPSPSAIASSAIIKVWGYIGTKSAGTSYPYSSSVDADIAADTNNWIQLGEHSISAGIATFTATEFQIDADAASTTYNAHFSVDICWPKIRFSAYSSISFQQQGTLKVVALVQ